MAHYDDFSDTESFLLPVARFQIAYHNLDMACHENMFS